MPLHAPQIDHVVINVLSTLDEAADRYRRLGFELTERGHHTLGSSNHLAMFGTDYLELLGFQPGRETRRPDLVSYPTGLSGLVLKPPADADFAEQLRAMGVAADEPQEFSRPVNLPGGPQDARFRTVNALGAIENGRLFFCHHYTPEVVWRDEWRQHANGATGITDFVIAARDVPRTAEVFERLFGPGASTPIEGGRAYTAGRATIRIITPDVLAATYGDAVPHQADGTDRMVALGLRTASLAQTKAALAKGGVSGTIIRGNQAVVPAAEACGLALLFAE